MVLVLNIIHEKCGCVIGIEIYVQGMWVLCWVFKFTLQVRICFLTADYRDTINFHGKDGCFLAGWYKKRHSHKQKAHNQVRLIHSRMLYEHINAELIKSKLILIL